MDLGPLYREILLPAKAHLERERRMSLLGLGVLALLGLPFLAVLALFTWALGWPLVVLLLLGAVSLLAWLYEVFEYNYRLHFFRKVADPLLARLAPGLVHQALGTLSVADVAQTGLFPFTPHLEGSGLVRGQVNGVAMKFAYVQAWRPSAQRSETRQDGAGAQLFAGVLFIADFAKPVTGQVVVLPDHLEPLLGHVAHDLQALSDYGALVRLEDPVFERYFRVYASDPIEARYLLSPALMQRLIEFRQSVDSPFSFSLWQGRLALAIPLRHNPLAPSLLKPALELSSLKQYIQDLQSLMALVEHLRLDVKIWQR